MMYLFCALTDLNGGGGDGGRRRTQGESIWMRSASFLSSMYYSHLKSAFCLVHAIPLVEIDNGMQG